MRNHPAAGTRGPLIIADAGIPGAEGAFSNYRPVGLVVPGQLGPETLADAEILVVRSVRRIGKDLLQGTPIRLVVSATAGTDHVDAEWLQRAGIAFRHTPGANADSVADYVVAALLRLCARRDKDPGRLVVGIVGCGEVGSRVVHRVRPLVARVLCCDPPRARLEGDSGFVDLGEVLASSDVVTLHTPLIRTGPDPTHHLLNRPRLERFGGWLINTARGEVVDGRALEDLLSEGRGPSAVVLDVFENEPWPSHDLIRLVDVATPHVAGYAAESKWNATAAAARHISAFTGVPFVTPESLPPIAPITMPAGGLAGLAAALCPLDRDDAALRRMWEEEDPGAAFERHRSKYPGKRLMSAQPVVGVPAELRDLTAVVLGCPMPDQSP